MENLVLIIIGLAIIYQSYKLIEQQRKLKRDITKMKEDYNIEFRGFGGSVSRQKKNYFEQEHQANDDFRYSISEPILTELRDNIDRKERHNVSGPLNKPTEEQIRSVEKARKKHND